MTVSEAKVIIKSFTWSRKDELGEAKGKEFDLNGLQSTVLMLPVEGGYIISPNEYGSLRGFWQKLIYFSVGSDRYPGFIVPPGGEMKDRGEAYDRYIKNDVWSTHLERVKPFRAYNPALLFNVSPSSGNAALCNVLIREWYTLKYGQVPSAQLYEHNRKYYWNIPGASEYERGIDALAQLVGTAYNTLNPDKVVSVQETTQSQREAEDDASYIALLIGLALGVIYVSN